MNKSMAALESHFDNIAHEMSERGGVSQASLDLLTARALIVIADMLQTMTNKDNGAPANALGLANVLSLNVQGSRTGPSPHQDSHISPVRSGNGKTRKELAS
jgi:hypothetical protein